MELVRKTKQSNKDDILKAVPIDPLLEEQANRARNKERKKNGGK